LWLTQKATDSLPEIEAAIAYPFEKTLSDLRDFETIFTGNAAEIRAAWFHAFRGMVGDASWWADQSAQASPKILAAMQGAFTSSFNWIMGRFNEIYGAVFGHPLFTAGGTSAPAPAPAPAGVPGSSPKSGGSLSTGPAGRRGGGSRGGASFIMRARRSRNSGFMPVRLSDLSAAPPLSGMSGIGPDGACGGERILRLPVA
jgi:hypothetical protein